MNTTSASVKRTAKIPGRAWSMAPVVVFVAASVAYAVIYLAAGRHDTFYADEWSFIISRRGWDAHGFLGFNNEHPALIPSIVYKILFETVGLRHYWPYRVGAVGIHVACSWLIFVYARRCAGAWFALASGLILLGLGSGWENILWPFQIGWTISIGCGIGSLLLLEKRSKESAIGAAVLIFASLASSGIGIPFAIIATIELAFDATRRRQLWVSLAPIALLGIWTLAESPFSSRTTGRYSIHEAPAWAWRGASGASGKILGADPLVGGILLSAFLGLLLLTVARKPRAHVRLVAILTGGGAYWAMIAISRSTSLTSPSTSRYIYPFTVLCLLAAAEALRHTRPIPPWINAAALTVAAISLVANIGPINDQGARTLQDNAELLRGDLAAIELSRGFVPADFVADRWIEGKRVAASPYLGLISQLGSPAYSRAEIPGLPERLRRRIDETAFLAGAVRTASVSGGQNLKCQAFKGKRELALPSQRTSVLAGNSPVSLSLRRFSNGFGPSPLLPGGLSIRKPPLPLTVAPKAGISLITAQPSADPPWRLQSDSRSPYRVCVAAAARTG